MNKSIFYRASLGNSLFVVIPVLAAFILGMVLSLSSLADSRSPFFYAGIALMIVGWGLLVRSKWDQVRKGDVWSFGISKDHPEMKWLYRCSYAVMISGWLMACLSGLL